MYMHMHMHMHTHTTYTRRLHTFLVAVALVLTLALAPALPARAATGGNVIGWGDNTYGEITVPTGLTGVTASSAGYEHSLALLSNGTVVQWGSTSNHQGPVPAGLSGVTAISAGSDYSLARKSTGTVVAWGANDFGQITLPIGLKNVAAISAGGLHALALTVLASTLTVATATGPYGGSAALAAALTDANGPISGQNVTFTLNGTIIGSALTNASGVAALPTATLGSILPGSYPTGADARFAGSTYDLTATTTTAALTVTKAMSTPVVVSSAGTSGYGAAVTFSATVPRASTGSAPTGSVTFTYGLTAGGMQTFIGTSAVTLNGTGKATSAGVVLPIGSYIVSAAYSGDANYAALSSTTAQTVTGFTALATTAPTGAGSSSASAPVFHTGTTFALTTIGTYSDGTHRSVSGLTYTGYNAAILTVDTSGDVTSLAPGTTTVTITGPGGVTTTMTITVSASSGLGAPITQPLVKAGVGIADATVVPQPTRKAGVGGTPAPIAQPGRH